MNNRVITQLLKYVLFMKIIKSCVTYESILKCPLDDAKIFFKKKYMFYASHNY